MFQRCTIVVLIYLNALVVCNAAILQHQTRLGSLDGRIRHAGSWRAHSSRSFLKGVTAAVRLKAAYQDVWSGQQQEEAGQQQHGWQQQQQQTSSHQHRQPQAAHYTRAAKRSIASEVSHEKARYSWRVTRTLPGTSGLAVPGDSSSGSSGGSEGADQVIVGTATRLFNHLSVGISSSSVSRRRSLLQVSTHPYSSHSSISYTTTDPDHLYNTLDGLGDTAWHTADTIGVLKGDSLDSVGNLLTAKGSHISGGMSIEDYERQQRYINAGDKLAYAKAPAINQAHSTAQDLARTLAPMAQQAHQDKQGLAVQAAGAIPDAMVSLAEGKATVVSTVHPFIHNGHTGPMDIGARAIKAGASAAQVVGHGTVVPMASGALTAKSNIGNYLGDGFQEGFYEGYQSSMDRRPPYADAHLQQQQYQQQPALYLPGSFSPLGAFANVTYPCPQAPNSAATAPVGTIIGPGIPCGTTIMLVPRSAVPTNKFGPTVVQPVPTNPPVLPPPAPASPTPIPVTPLPPGGVSPPAPPEGGGTTLPPDVTPPNVRPPTGDTTVPPPTPIPTVPPNTGTTPTPTPTPSPAVPDGLQPPNTRTRSYNSIGSNNVYNYMSLEGAEQQAQQYRMPGQQQVQMQQLQQQQQQQQVQLQRLQQQEQAYERVVVSGPYNTADEAAAAAAGVRGGVSRRSGAGYGPAAAELGRQTGGSSSSNTVLRQLMTPSLLSMMGRRLRALQQEAFPA